jgi:peptidoglycan/xylan/chitin deacetylase (PgdA/CDA1 family)
LPQPPFSDDRLARRRARERQVRRRRRTLGAVLALVLAAAVVAVIVASSGGSSGASSAGSSSTAAAASSAGKRVHRRAAAPLPGSETTGDHPARHEPVPVLMYHVIGYVKPGTPNQELWVSPSTFAGTVRALARAGYHGVTLQRVWDAWHGRGQLPSKPVVFSFDDGYYGQYRNARPTLAHQGWPGVLNLKLGNLADMGGPANIKRMVAEGWEIDDHTITHPDLTTVGASALRYEIGTSRQRFHKLFGVPANFFCYPAGRYDAAVIAEVKRAGFNAATSTRFGFARPQDTYTLARVRVNRSDGVDGVLRNLRTMGANPDTAPTGGGGE